MYRYDEFDHQFVRERTSQFRNQAGVAGIARMQGGQVEQGRPRGR